MDFLSTCNNFDYLLVNDAQVSDVFGLNPYLPSKVSDYKGSKAKILALIEKGSALSYDSDLKYLVEINDISGVDSILREMTQGISI